LARNCPGGRQGQHQLARLPGGDYIIKDYKFVSGETLPEVKLHYRTIGTAKKNAAGDIVNGVDQ